MASSLFAQNLGQGQAHFSPFTSSQFTQLPNPDLGPEYMNQSRLMGQQEEGANYRARLAAQTSMYPYQLKQQHWQQVFPLLQSQMNSAGGGAGYFGAPTAGPAISSAPVYNGQQIQQQANLLRSHNEQETGGQVHNMNAQLGARGFANNAPLQQYMTAMYQGQGNAASTEAENNLRFQAAQANAKQVLAGQMAQEEQAANRNRERIQQGSSLLGADTSRHNALLQALAGLV